MHTQTNKRNTYIQTCQTLQMFLIIGYSVWNKMSFFKTVGPYCWVGQSTRHHAAQVTDSVRFDSYSEPTDRNLAYFLAGNLASTLDVCYSRRHVTTTITTAMAISVGTMMTSPIWRTMTSRRQLTTCLVGIHESPSLLLV